MDYKCFVTNQAWIANDDSEVEGKWENWYNDQVPAINSLIISVIIIIISAIIISVIIIIVDVNIYRYRIASHLNNSQQCNAHQALEYQPWADARPYDGGFRYNCMMLQVTELVAVWPG